MTLSRKGPTNKMHDSLRLGHGEMYKDAREVMY